jgi:hypothetical protein
MSTLKVDAIVDSSAGNTTTINGATPTAYNTMGKNRIINGAMEIDQRNAGASVTPTTNVTYTLDRWAMTLSQSSKYSVQQQTSVVPVGFTNAMKFTSLSSYSVGAEVFGFRQMIEGYNVPDLNWGTANAKSITLSFYVYSSLTGTFGGALLNSAENRSYPFEYTISSANTWEQKTVTIAGDTSGTWVTNNGTGIQLHFSLGVGSSLSGTAGAWAGTNYYSATGATSVVGTSGATFYITGVQLEAGSVATEFERRPYGTELALCQRYFYYYDVQVDSETARGVAQSSTTVFYNFNVPVPLRTTPTVVFAGYTGLRQRGGGVNNSTTSLTINTVYYSPNANLVSMYCTTSGNSGTVPYAIVLSSPDGTGYLTASAEL